MKKKDDERSEFLRAADALDHELVRFADLSRQIQKEPLGNQKSLDRAVSLFKQVTEAESTLRTAMTALVQALGAAQKQQQAEVELVNVKAIELEQRHASLLELNVRYEALGQVAVQVNQALLALGGKKLTENEYAAQAAAALPELISALSRATDAAKELVGAAQEKGFPDVGRNAETLRQQILAAQNKLNLLQDKLGPA